MKHFLLSVLIALTFCTVSFGQELAMVRDTVNNFEIGVPVGWRYGVPSDNSLSFIALRQKEAAEDVPRENFNINILHREETDLDGTYRVFLESVGNAACFKIVEQGDTVINDRRYKYLIETHTNKVSSESMSNYVLLTNNNGEVLILTMVTTAQNFHAYRPLFDRVAQSLRY